MNSVGVHRLLTDGAEVVTSVDMIAERYKQRQISIEEVEDEKNKTGRSAFSRSNFGGWKWLYDKIDDFGSSPEELCSATGESPSKIQTGLTMLEMGGWIERRDGLKIYRK